MSKGSHNDMRLRRNLPLAAVFLFVSVFALSSCGKSVEGYPYAAEALSEEVTKVSSDVKIATKKKTLGYYVCDFLTPTDIAAATGAKVVGNERGCLQKTTAPSMSVRFQLSAAEYTGAASEIEISGNTAFEVKGFRNECLTLVMLTDNLEEATPAFLVNVTPTDNMDACAFARNIATKVFEKLPDA